GFTERPALLEMGRHWRGARVPFRRAGPRPLSQQLNLCRRQFHFALEPRGGGQPRRHITPSSYGSNEAGTFGGILIGRQRERRDGQSCEAPGEFWAPVFGRTRHSTDCHRTSTPTPSLRT